MPASSNSNAVYPVTMELMDRAEALARDCFEKQGMPTEARLVATMVPEAPAAAPALVDLKSPAPSSRNPFKWVLFIPVLLPLSLIAAVFADYAKNNASSSTHAAPSAQAIQWTGIRTVRGMAARLTTDEARTILAAPSGSKDVNAIADIYGITPEAVVTTRRLGKVSVIDRVGRPEVHWSGVSQETCTAIVQDIYGSPSESGVQASVDGKSVGVSCDGPSHEVVLSPHL